MDIAIPLPEKSTTVRLRPLPIPAALRAGFRLGAFLSPAWTARAARHLFFTPTRSRRRPEQEAILARGRRLSIATREGTVAAWSWGHGETVMLLHGWGGHAGQLTPFVAPLLDAGFAVLALDLPAHGDSPGRQASVRHFAGAILDAAEPFGPLAGIVAHSFGSAATTLAFDSGLYARAAVFVAPPSRFGTFFARASEGFGLAASVARLLERDAEEWVGLHFEEVEPRRLATHQDAPLLVLHDRGDDEVPFAEGEELARRWPNARFVPTDDLGHYRILRDPAVLSMTTDFLAAARSASAKPQRDTIAV